MMKKLAHIISARIYLLLVKVVTGRSASETKGDLSLEEYGSTLMFSWFTYLTLLVIALSIFVGITGHLWAYIYLNYIE